MKLTAYEKLLILFVGVLLILSLGSAAEAPVLVKMENAGQISVTGQPTQR